MQMTKVNCENVHIQTQLIFTWHCVKWAISWNLRDRDIPRHSANPGSERDVSAKVTCHRVSCSWHVFCGVSGQIKVLGTSSVACRGKSEHWYLTARFQWMSQTTSFWCLFFENENWILRTYLCLFQFRLQILHLTRCAYLSKLIVTSLADVHISIS